MTGTSEIHSASSPLVPRFYDLIGADHDYPAWTGAPHRTLVICTHPRSGSTMLGEALYFAGGLGCALEYFHPGFRMPLAARWQTGDVGEFVAAVHRWRTDPSGTLAVKLFWGVVEKLAEELAPARFATLGGAGPADVSPQTYRDIAELLAPILPASRYIHLVRQDRVRRAVSASVAEQTGIWRAINGTVRPPAGHIRFDYDDIAARLALADRNHAHWCNFLAAIGAAPLRVDYEAMANDPPAAIAPLLAALGRGVPVPPVRLDRQASGDNERLVMAFLREHRRRLTVRADS